jgi:hypothetical protein
LDALSPAASAALLSALEAKQRLHEIVEGFLRRLRSEDGKRIQRLLVKSPPGLGKTREAIDLAIPYRAEQEGKDLLLLPRGDYNEAGVPAQTSIFVPRHQLAEELGEVIERAFLERGEGDQGAYLACREKGGEERNAPCRTGREPRELRRKGLPIYTNLGQRTADGQANRASTYGSPAANRSRTADESVQERQKSSEVSNRGMRSRRGD